MRRPILLTFITLGAIVTGLGGTGLFAALNDDASSGTNAVTSETLGPSADLKLSSATMDESSSTMSCGTFGDDLTTPIVDVADVAPGADTWSYFCLRNDGVAPVTLSASLTEFVSGETGCTGDESAFDPDSCGTGPGELPPVLEHVFGEYGCLGSGTTYYGGDTLAATSATPVAIGTLGAGEQKCYLARIAYPPNTTNDTRQAAQSDQATWRYQFHAAA